MSIPFHALSEIFPSLIGPEFDALVDDIRDNGLREPIVLFDGQVLDGRNRYRACQAADVEPRFETYEGDDPVRYVISLNLRRRHLDESQRGLASARLENLPRGRPANKDANLHVFGADSDAADDSTGIEDANWDEVFEDAGVARKPSPAPIAPVSRTQAASMLNVSERTVATAAKVLKEGAPELVTAVEHGRVSVSAAAAIATRPKIEQAEIVALDDAEIKRRAKAIRERETQERREANASIAKQLVVLPVGKVSTIVIDPPWPMQKIDRDVRPNQVGFDYPTMSEDELVAFRETIDAVSADDCHLFMWTTQKFLPVALRLLNAWDFRYVLTMVWHKPGGFQPIGLPQYNCEFAVYARRGSPAFADTKAFPCCFEAPRREHSRKPDEFYDVIARVTEGERIDIFSRGPHEGFAQFGNEADKFAGAA
jgi:N6-adenosine-specific RNA methylase IME4